MRCSARSAGGSRGYRVASIFVFCGLLLGVAAYWFADRVAMGMVGARELLPGEAPLLHSSVERLAARAGVVKPRLYVIPDGFPRVLSAGRGAMHLGARRQHGRARLGGARGGRRAARARDRAREEPRRAGPDDRGRARGGRSLEVSRVGGWLSRALLYVLGPVAASFVHLLLSPRREFEADRLAAALCESPHGLADALLRLEQASELVSFQASPATEPLYTINPFAEEGLAKLFVTHPPVGERVRRLRELDPDWREKLRAA